MTHPNTSHLQSPPLKPNPQGPKSSVYVHPADTVGRLKQLIEALHKTPPDEQFLHFNGVRLDDDHTLSDYNIEAGDTIHMVLRLEGGMEEVSS